MKLFFTFSRAVLFFCLITFGSTVVAGDITKIQMHVDEANQTKLGIRFQTDHPPKLFTLNEGNPRIIIDITDVKLDAAMEAKGGNKGNFGGVGAVTKLRFARYNENKHGEKSLRFVADLRPGARYLSHSYSEGMLVVLVTGGVVQQTIGGIPVPRIKPDIGVDDGNPVPRLKSSRLKTLREAKPVKKPVIVIDPGHGGHDPGAIGSAKVHEETVTLNAGLELRKQLLASRKYKVAMTRATDKYIEHDKRVLIARKAGADLFISIHADSTSNSSTRGASVYTLASRAEARTYKVVSNQNWVLDVDLTRKSAPVSGILVDLAQRKTLTKSGRFANILISELKKQTRLVGNSHRRAGYYVLLAPDVPAVLLEMGFISNWQDEKLLNSTTHRKKLMKSVVSAIDKYFYTQTRLQRGG